MKKKVLVHPLEKSLPMVIHQNNCLNILVKVNHVESIKFGPLDICVINVCDSTLAQFKIQINKYGAAISREIAKNQILLVKKISITAIGQNFDEIVGVASDESTILRINPSENKSFCMFPFFY